MFKRCRLCKTGQTWEVISMAEKILQPRQTTIAEKLQLYRKMFELCGALLAPGQEHFLLCYDEAETFAQGAALMMLEDLGPHVHYLTREFFAQHVYDFRSKEGDFILFRVLTTEDGETELSYERDVEYAEEPDGHALPWQTLPQHCHVVTLRVPYDKQRSALLEIHTCIMQVLSAAEQKKHPSAITVADLEARCHQIMEEMKTQVQQNEWTMARLNRLPEPWRELVWDCYLCGVAEGAKLGMSFGMLGNQLQDFIREHGEVLADA